MLGNDNVEGFIPEVAYLRGSDYLADANIAQLHNTFDDDNNNVNISEALELKIVNSDKHTDIIARGKHKCCRKSYKTRHTANG